MTTIPRVTRVSPSGFHAWGLADGESGRGYHPGRVLSNAEAISYARGWSEGNALAARRNPEIARFLRTAIFVEAVNG